MTAQDVLGAGVQGGKKERYGGTTHGTESLVEKKMLSIVVFRGQVNAIVRIVVEASRTGEIGDGKVRGSWWRMREREGRARGNRKKRRFLSFSLTRAKKTKKNSKLKTDLRLPRGRRRPREDRRDGSQRREDGRGDERPADWDPAVEGEEKRGGCGERRREEEREEGKTFFFLLCCFFFLSARNRQPPAARKGGKREKQNKKKEKRLRRSFFPLSFLESLL